MLHRLDHSINTLALPWVRTGENRSARFAAWGERLWRKERVDLLCGCKLYYPDSPGAKQ